MADQNLAAKKSDFISRLVAQAVATKQAIDSLYALRIEYDNNGYFDGEFAIAQSDISGANQHLDVDLITSAVTTAELIRDFVYDNAHDDILDQIRA